MEDAVGWIAEGNLKAWSESGVVKTLKIYSGKAGKVCDFCKQRAGTVIVTGDGIVGKTLPPFAACANAFCRCYFRPEGISIE